MSSLTFNVHSDSDITLPGEIANSTLSLAEIGAVVVFSAMQIGVIPETRIGSDEMKAATSALKDKGVLKVGIENKVLKITLDLESVFQTAMMATKNNAFVIYA